MLFDERVVEELAGITPEWLALVLLAFGFLGSVYVVGPGVVVGTLTGGRARATWPAIICLPYGTFVFLKPAVGLDRPDVPSPVDTEGLPVAVSLLYEVGTAFSTGAFPSGHVIVATVFWGLFVVDTGLFTARGRTFLAASIVTLVGLSRVALGVHYVGDVVGGAVIGLAVLGVALAVRRRLSEPFRPLLLLAAVPTVGGIALGRLDGVALLALVGGIALAHRWVQQADSHPIDVLKSRTHRWSES